MKKALLLFFAGVALLSCKQAEKPAVASAQTVDMEAAKKFIDAANIRFGKAMAAGDSATLTAMYHSEAQLFPPAMPMMDNRSGMGTMVKELPKMGIKSVQLKSAELLNGGEYVIERGTYDMGDSTKSFDKGKYMVVWKQEGGEWKLYRDIWNSDSPPSRQ